MCFSTLQEHDSSKQLTASSFNNTMLPAKAHAFVVPTVNAGRQSKVYWHPKGNDMFSRIKLPGEPHQLTWQTIRNTTFPRQMKITSNPWSNELSTQVSGWSKQPLEHSSRVSILERFTAAESTTCDQRLSPPGWTPPATSPRRLHSLLRLKLTAKGSTPPDWTSSTRSPRPPLSPPPWRPPTAATTSSPL